MPAVPEPQRAEDRAATAEGPSGGIPTDLLHAGLRSIGLEFTEDEVRLMARRKATHLASYERMRAVRIPHELPPAFRFEPGVPGVVGRDPRVPPGDVKLVPTTPPSSPDDLAWLTIPELAWLIRERAISCLELVTASLDRLHRLDPMLRCVVTLTEERALAQARERDAELAAGRWRGPLHGIPWGAKDLLAVRGYPTTWGTPPFADQRLEADATVVERLDEAGAVLVAKLSLGELAWGDVWTGGRTNNPWDVSEGSSGSSAGSAAAVAAGCVPFSIGSETLGSIVSPARQCGVTGVRPTYGRVSRDGAMALAWTLDKLGPMARSATDAAIVLAAIAGPDGHDETVSAEPVYVPSGTDPTGWRIGVVESAFEAAPSVRPALEELRKLGCELVPFEMPSFQPDDAWVILDAEAGASFDDFTREGRVREMVRQEDEAWPNVFRAGRLIPAVEYLRASRIRRALQIELDERMRDCDLLVHPSDEDVTLTIENLTGHPAVALPWGRRENGAPESVTLAGHLYREPDLLAFAAAWQARSDHHQRHPPL